jgi:glucosamine-6-phosphate deaminase
MTDAQPLASGGRLTAKVFGNKAALGAAAAALVAGRLAAAIAKHGEANLIVATGASQYEFLDAFRQCTGVAWDKVTVFHLDEYLGLSAQHPASFRRYLHERLFAFLPFGAVHLLEGDAADPAAEAARYAALLAGRRIDVACIGIGENGHLAFNDPPADFETPALVHIQTLDLACRQQQVGEGHFATVDQVPTRALTLTIPAIMAARTISCVCPDQRKAAAVQQTLEGPITPDCPASVLRRHGDCHLFLDAYSAERLSRRPAPGEG